MITDLMMRVAKLIRLASKKVYYFSKILTRYTAYTLNSSFGIKYNQKKARKKMFHVIIWT